MPNRPDSLSPYLLISVVAWLNYRTLFLLRLDYLEPFQLRMAFGGIGLTFPRASAVDQDSPAIGRKHARYDFDQRRFAGAVLAEQRVDLASRHRKRYVVERADARERVLEIAHLEQRGRSGT